MKILQTVLSAALAINVLSAGAADVTGKKPTTNYPWSEIFSNHGLNDRISISALSTSQGKPFYQNGEAAGLWALTPPVAIHYGLEINDRIDQRFDPELSAEAAAQYISDLIRYHDNDTTMALAAYNIGAARLSDTLKMTNLTPKIQYEKFTYTTVTPTLDSIYHHLSGHKQTTVSPVRISVILDSGHIDYRTFRLLNPTIRQDAEWIIAQQTVFLPDTTLLNTLYASEQVIYDSITANMLQLAAIQTDTRQKAIKSANAEIVYRIRPGDTLGHIARKYNVTVRQLKSWNNLKSDMIRAGQSIRIKTN